MNAPKFIYAFGFAVTLMAGITSCSINKTADHMSAIEQNQPIDVNSLYKEELEDKGLDVELYLLEKGRIAQLEDNFEVSRANFNEEVEFVKKRELEDNTLPGADINIGSVLVNDNMLAYKARLFELEMVYLYQSYNYLALGDLEGAIVEIRLAEFLLNEAEKAREREAFKEEYFRNTEESVQKKIFDNEKAIQKGTMKNQLELNDTRDKSDTLLALMTDNNSRGVSSPPVDTDTYAIAGSEPADYSSISQEESYRNELQKISDQNFAEMAELLGKTKSSVLNPYVVFVGGVIHEMNQEFDDAYISYKKSLELMPSNPYLQREVVRTAIKLDKMYDFDKLKAAYPEVWKQVESIRGAPEDNGKLVIIYEDGWTPQKQEVFITLGAVAIAYPVYKFIWTEPQPMLVSASSGEIGTTYPICYLGSLALRALQEEAKWRIIRQAARAAIKGGTFAAGTAMAAAGPNDNVKLAGLGIMAASSIYNNLSENADLRCWMTLPENVQILVANLPSGNHTLTFAPQGTQLQREEIVPITKGQITLVWIVHVGSSLDYDCLWPRTPNSVKRDITI